MQVWQHLDKSDHLRRRAEDMIEDARGHQATGAFSKRHRPNAQEAHKLELRDGIQNTPGLVDAAN